jgi:hypothetical protein
VTIFPALAAFPVTIFFDAIPSTFHWFLEVLTRMRVAHRECPEKREPYHDRFGARQK